MVELSWFVMNNPWFELSSVRLSVIWNENVPILIAIPDAWFFDELTDSNSAGPFIVFISTPSFSLASNTDDTTWSLPREFFTCRPTPFPLTTV